MPPARTFMALGLFVREGFLPSDACRALATCMLANTGELGGIFGDAPDGAPNPEVRRAFEVDVPQDLTDAVESRLPRLGAELEEHFGIRLREPEAPAYLRYPQGAFYLPHTDRRKTPDESDTHRRAISVVLFVNGPGEDPPFEGGRLRFYGLLGEGALAELGIDVEPQGGTLIAFPSTLLHEVTRIESGVRCSVVGWFLEAD